MRSTANMVQAAFCWAIVIFSVSTMAIAVQKAPINGQHTNVREKFDNLESKLREQVHLNESLWPEINVDETLNFRLPKALKPTHYDLLIQPNLEAGNFTGVVSIAIDVIESTQKIVLHASNLYIRSVSVTDPSGEDLLIEKKVLEPTRELLIIDLAEELKANTKINFGVLFGGVMNNKIVGLYSSSYSTPENEQRTIATSKFEPTYARQAFPCFDEPAMKATFSVFLVHPTEGEYHALSNMDVSSTAINGAYTEVSFAESVPMSTYLACFIISDFVYNSKSVNAHGIGDNFDVRVFATKHQLNKVNFALDTAVAVTEFFIDYYQVEYPLPKLDLAAIPDFASNAMEHWGLVTFRETALLFDKDYSSTWNKQRIAAVVTHELAHMWFGNLVTMKWWNDLWLNEGFARYMEYKGVNAIYEDWGMNDQFLIHALQSVLQFDARTASHPIIQTVETPDQITEIFDTISYEKGASVIRMLEDAVGAEKFAEGVTNYLKAFKYMNAETNDFIGELEKLNLDFDVRHFMRTWTEQMGFPILNVRRRSAGEFIITQQRFFSNIEDYDEVHNDTEFNYTWTIPLTYFLDQKREVSSLWFKYNVEAVGVAVTAETKWIKLNAHQVGYYRVNYDEQIWYAIIEDLKNKPESFDIADRAHLLNDIFAIADASQLSYDTAMEITQYLSKEQDFVPWYVAASKLLALQSTLMWREAYVDYLRYARTLIRDIYQTVGGNVDEDNHAKNRLRVTILTAACALGLPECLTEASKQFSAWLNEPNNKPAPDLREIVYYYGMQQLGDEQVWEFVWNIFVDEKDASEKSKLMYGLAGVKIPWLLRRFIELASDERFVRRQDYFTCIQNIASNPIGEPIVWEYIRDKWPVLVQRFGLNDRYLGRIIPTITSRFDTATKLEDMQEFFNKYPDAGAGAVSRMQALETIKFNIKWLNNNEQKLSEWLKQQRQYV